MQEEEDFNVKKGVYLFSVALLGVSLCPSLVFAEEAVDVAAPEITAEFIEGSADQVSEGVEPDQPVNLPEESVSQAANDNDPAESSNEAIPETVSEATVEATQDPAPNVESENSKIEESPAVQQAAVENSESAKTSAPESIAPVAQTETRALLAAAQKLTDDYDGKIVDHAKTSTDKDAKISSEYNFMPNFENLAGILVEGTKDFRETDSYFRFELKSAAPNTISVTYKNVGTYKGKVIDMKVTVKNWTAFTGSYYANELTVYKSNGISMRGISDVHLNYAFLDNLTGKEVSLSGFFNFTDIDLKQSIDLFDNNNVQNFYVTKGNMLYYKVHNGYIKIGEINGGGTVDTNMDYWLTYTYKNISNFDVRYNQEYETGALFAYSYQAPVVIEESLPIEIIPVVPNVPDVPEKEVETPAKEMPAPEKQTPTKVTVKEKAKLVQLVAQKPVLLAATKTIGLPATQPVTETAPVLQVEQRRLPQTNEKKASIFTTLGGTALVFLSGLFIKKKKTDKE